MTWTYDVTSRTDRNKVREAIGDTNADDEQVQDEVIDEQLTARGSVIAASIACVRLILASIAREGNRSVAGVNITRDLAAQNYKDLLRELERQAGSGAKGYAGGISAAEQETADGDDDYPAPAFSVGMGRNS